MLYWHRPVIRYRMRRVFVIFLILLFPLNVFALSHSMATAGPGAAPFLAASEGQAYSATSAADIGIDTASELDPDEPPAGMDLHDIVDLDPGLRLAALREAGAAPRTARRPWHALCPPLRPPRAA